MEAHSAAQGGAENCRHLRELGIKTSSNFQVPTHRHVSRRTREKAKARRPYYFATHNETRGPCPPNPYQASQSRQVPYHHTVPYH